MRRDQPSEAKRQYLRSPRTKKDWVQYLAATEMRLATAKGQKTP